MFYLDPHTTSIVAGLPDETVQDSGEYVGILASHPVTMAGVFLRHAVNGLDQRYTTPYVEDLDPPGRWILRLGGFLLVFLAVFRLVWPRGGRSLGPAAWRYPGALLICCLTILPSAVEPRYMLPVFLLSSLVVLAPGWPNPLEQAAGWRRYRTVGVACGALAVYLLVVHSIVSEASNHLVRA